jgi:hypothetical protein
MLGNQVWEDILYGNNLLEEYFKIADWLMRAK